MKKSVAVLGMMAAAMEGLGQEALESAEMTKQLREAQHMYEGTPAPHNWSKVEMTKAQKKRRKSAMLGRRANRRNR